MKLRPLAALIVCAWGVAHADGDPRALIQRGQKLAQQKKFEEALALFKEAAVLAPTADNACLIALVYMRMHRVAESAHFLFLAKAAGGAEAAYCADLRGSVVKYLSGGAFAPVTVTLVPADAIATIGDFAADEHVVNGETIWLPFGRHAVAVSAAEHVSRDVPVEISDRHPIDLPITLEPVAPPPVVTPPPPLVVTPPPPADEHMVEEMIQVRAPGPGPLPWVALSVGVAAIGVGVLFHVEASSARADANGLPAGAAFDSKLSTFELDRGLALGCYAAGAVVAGVGIYILAHHPKWLIHGGYFAPGPSGASAGLRWSLW